MCQFSHMMENKSQLVHMNVYTQLFMSNERWCYSKYFGTIDTKHCWNNDHRDMLWMCVSFCCLVIIDQAHSSVSFNTNTCVWIYISYKRIYFVHSNDVSSDHMQLYPSNINLLKPKSLNKSLKIPLRSIQTQCGVITTAFFGDNMCTYSTQIELQVTQLWPCLFNHLQ